MEALNIIQTVHKALSDSDIKHILGSDCKIIKYSELSKYNSLEELVPKLIDYVVILYEEQENTGHWVGLMKYNNLYEFFDPYGLQPDKELSWINLKTRRMLNEITPYLTNLLKNERYIYNRIKYQLGDSFVNTCGSHVVHRIYRLINNNMVLEEYHKFMRDLMNDSKFNYDLIVSTFVQLKLDH